MEEKMDKFLIHTKDLIKSLITLVFLPFIKLFHKEKIYLIGERKDQCQDNGYHLFKYIRECHPKDKIYYCITKDSKQLEKIKPLGNIVYHNSIKHYIYYFLAEKVIGAHVGSCDPESPFIWFLERKGYLKKYRIFLQHGIIKEFIPTLKKSNTGINIFVCGAKPEYDYVKANFGYKEEVKYLGLCRFDSLHNFKEKNQILLMPTWRAWFGGSTWGIDNDEEFLNSQYYLRYQSLINNELLIKDLKNKKIKLIFYPHHEMQRYLKYFSTSSTEIIIANPNECEVQDLLKDSKILITDYSSIAFDFAYMRKPVIYYQFDEEEYYAKHYQKGYFDYSRDGFGPIVKEEKTLIELLVNNDLNLLQNIYKQRAKEFFPIYDKYNCLRNYEEIQKNIN